MSMLHLTSYFLPIKSVYMKFLFILSCRMFCNIISSKIFRTALTRLRAILNDAYHHDQESITSMWSYFDLF